MQENAQPFTVEHRIARHLNVVGTIVEVDTVGTRITPPRRTFRRADAIENDVIQQPYTAHCLVVTIPDI